MIKIKSFSGDYQKVYELIKKSWQDDYVNTYRQPVQDFTPEFLRWNIEREGYDPDLILEGYIKNNLVGFSANMPRKLIYDGKIIKAVLTTFISVHPQTKNKGIGKRLLDEQIFRIKEKKYGLNYFINDEGHISEKMFANLSLRIGTPVLNYHRFTFLTKPLDAGKIKKIEKLSFSENAVLPFISPVKKKNTHKSTPPPPSYSSREIDEIYAVMSKKTTKEGVRSYVSRTDLPDQLASNVSATVFEHQGDKTGLLNYYNIDLISGIDPDYKAKTTMIDFVDFKNYSFVEKHGFIKKFCLKQAEKGSALILLPTMPLFDLKPFYTNFFIPTGRYHNIRAFDFNRCLPEDVAVENIIFR